MNQTDKRLMADLLEAAENYLIALVVAVIDRSQMGVQATHQDEVRAKLVDAIAEVAKRSQENGR
jgi:transcriptional regulator CtsR